ncbi:MAG TPA: outer membrane protein assembly factor BamD [Thermoanaerobaculia bacterium]|nr:outer membrane protein assembly factor BamD [Thermoanaerobaculia bacterium]
MVNIRRMALAAFVAAMIVTGCSSSRSQEPVVRVDPELANLSKEEIFDRAEAQYAAKKWSRARRYYGHVYESNPNDPLGRRSLLRIADTYFQHGDPVNLVEAQYKYRDFVNRYPASEQADYAMLQIAMVAHKQMEPPDRDQTKTHEAIDKFNEMMVAYPNSPLRAQAEKGLQEALDRLATHDHLVARFYLRRGNALAALGRLNYLVETYPNFVDRDEVFYDLGRTLEKLGRQAEARLYYERVIAEYPDSEWAGDARDKLEDLSA